MRHGVEEPRQHFPAVIKDVAVVQGDGVDIPFREDAAEGHPHRSSFARVVHGEIVSRQFPVKFLHPRAVVPDDLHLGLGSTDMCSLAFSNSLLHRPGPGRERSCVEVVHILQFLDDPGHGRGLEFRVQRGQQQHELPSPRDAS